MTRPFSEVLSERRRLLNNQYAYIPEVEELSELERSRKKSECPYAHIEETERLNRHISRFDGIEVDAAKPEQAKKYTPKTDFDIQRLVHELHVQIWENRASLFPDSAKMKPVEMLDPVAALEMLGYEVEMVGALGQLFDTGRNKSDIAGLIDKSARRVELSSGLPPATRNFTAAHELGHAVMHEFVGMHRDKPLDGSANSGDPIEREAEKFAAYFLMPEKLLRSMFESIFCQVPFGLSDETRFALAGSIPHPNWQPRNLRDFSRAIASTPRFNGSSIIPLMDQFKVSKEAMAIRLEQLGLVTLK